MVTLRPALHSDRPFLEQMLEVAFDWRGDAPAQVLSTLMQRPETAHYVEGWPREGDVGFVADDGDPIGAAWWRYLTHDDPGYGYVDDNTPEISMGVVASHRGQGVGTALLGALCNEARRRDMPALSLSVEDGNRAAALYRRLGFESIGRVGNSDTMVLELHS